MINTSNVIFHRCLDMGAALHYAPDNGLAPPWLQINGAWCMHLLRDSPVSVELPVSAMRTFPLLLASPSYPRFARYPLFCPAVISSMNGGSNKAGKRHRLSERRLPEGLLMLPPLTLCDRGVCTNLTVMISCARLMEHGAGYDRCRLTGGWACPIS